MSRISDAIASLRTEVERNTTVDGSAKALIDQFVALVEENKNAPDQIQALVDQFRSDSDSLAAAVQANTPSA